MSPSSSSPRLNPMQSGKVVDTGSCVPDFTDVELAMLLEALLNFPDLHPRRSAALRLGSKINTFAIQRQAQR